MLLMVERRRRTQRNHDDDAGATGKNPRRSKARPKRNAERQPAPQQDGRQESQDLREPTPAQNSSLEDPRITLPGVFYPRAGRWWWRVKLPGENKAKARPLKRAGEKTAIAHGEAAGKIALEMWEHALHESAVRQVQLESTEKIERLKAQFLDKVRHFTELVETANAKIEAETKARAEAEAKLAQMAQGPEPTVPDNRPKIEDKEPATPQIDAQVGDTESTTPPVVRATGPQTHDAAFGSPMHASPLPPAVGACECCGTTDIPLADLRRIDSGQLLCPRCLAALRADVVRTESTPA
jgi:hypothetical protein